MKKFDFLKSLGAVAMGLFITTNFGIAQNRNPGVLPPVSTPQGHSYGEWSAQWWQWALGIPGDEEHPLLDTTGEFCHVGQTGSVWFLGGTFGGGPPIERSCTVPVGKMLFFPIINSVWITTCVGEPRTKDGIRPMIAPFIDNAMGLAVMVDGEDLQDLGQYRAESPLFCTPLALYGVYDAEDLEMFPCLEGSDPNCSELPNPEEHFGTFEGFGPAMSDGYWIMLAPLSVGEHTLHFSASSMPPLVSSDVTYHLTVVPNGPKAR